MGSANGSVEWKQGQNCTYYILTPGLRETLKEEDTDGDIDEEIWAHKEEWKSLCDNDLITKMSL